jgi:hypothetical protein
MNGLSVDSALPGFLPAAEAFVSPGGVRQDRSREIPERLITMRITHFLLLTPRVMTTSRLASSAFVAMLLASHLRAASFKSRIRAVTFGRPAAALSFAYPTWCGRCSPLATPTAGRLRPPLPRMTPVSVTENDATKSEGHDQHRNDGDRAEHAISSAFLAAPVFAVA